MSREEIGPSADRLRDLVSLRVEAASLRQIAGEIGVSPAGLSKYLDGASPHSSTRRKLIEWYVRHARNEGGQVNSESATAALELLLQGLPPRVRRRAARQIARALKGGYASAEMPPPAWVIELLVELEEEETDIEG